MPTKGRPKEPKIISATRPTFHVHVNRNAFGPKKKRQEDVIARILFFVENHWNELLRFSRRSQMEQWAARYGREDDPKAVPDHAKESHRGR